MIREIVKVHYEGDSAPYYVFASPYDDESEIVGRGTDSATLEELVDLCDRDAENRNAHDFCGVHRLLGALLYNQTGRPAATALMAWIAQRGGLQGMAGICSDGDAYGELNVGEAGRDWSGAFGP